MVTESSLKGRILQILPRVAKPARYTGGELNSIRKPPADVSVRFALAFPDVYEVGMSNLGLRILYHILNAQPGVAAERVFAPAPDMNREMREADIPLFSLESSLPVRDFDVVGFSLAYEMSYTTVLDMLELAGIPVYSRDRSGDDPIIIAGGHCASNPEPMADFIDAFAIGDGEDVVLDIARECAAHRGDRAATLEALAQIEGMYVPVYRELVPDTPVAPVVSGDPSPETGTESVSGQGCPETTSVSGTSSRNTGVVRARRVADLETADFPDKLIVPFTEAVHDRVALEIMRGCARGCRFCQAGMITRPVRHRSLSTLCDQADVLLDATGYEEIALTSLSSADHPQINELVRALIDRHEADRVGISLPSLRADAGCVHLAAEIQRVRKSGLTFAPEAGTQRLRDVINKNVTEEDLLDAVDAAVEHGWKRVKLYFMIGLPTETDDDLRGIADLVHKVMAVGRKRGVRLTVNVTISPFVPKPHTPFQWRGMVGLEELERRIALIRPLLKDRSIALSWHDPACSRVEAALARGDRALSKVIYEAWKRGGRLEQDCFDNSRWLAAFDAAGVDMAHYANRDIPTDSPLPWDHIDMGVTKAFLARENAKADSAEPTLDCRFGACSGCGIKCREAESGEGRAEKTPHPSPLPQGEREQVVPQASSLNPQRILLTFRKAEAARWLGHLDLMRVFERAVRMSKVEIAYTQGFNPRPRMSIASALPLGATADAELLTLEMARPVDLTDAISRLNKALPEGVAIVEGQVLPDNKRGPSIAAGEFVVELTLPNEKAAERLSWAADSLMAQECILRERESGGKRRTIDLRAGVDRLRVTERPTPLTARIEMVLPHREYTVKPSEVVDALSGLVPGIGVNWTHRSRLITQDVREASRKSPSGKEVRTQR